MHILYLYFKYKNTYLRVCISYTYTLNIRIHIFVYAMHILYLYFKYKNTYLRVCISYTYTLNIRIHIFVYVYLILIYFLANQWAKKLLGFYKNSIFVYWRHFDTNFILFRCSFRFRRRFFYVYSGSSYCITLRVLTLLVKGCSDSIIREGGRGGEVNLPPL